MKLFRSQDVRSLSIQKHDGELEGPIQASVASASRPSTYFPADGARCTACWQIRPSSDFSANQYNDVAASHRRCKECIKHSRCSTSEPQGTSNPASFTCSSCKKTRHRECYSKKQLKGLASERKCNQCTAYNCTPIGTSALDGAIREHAVRCSSCAELKDRDAYSRKQLKNRADDRRCRQCTGY